MTAVPTPPTPREQAALFYFRMAVFVGLTADIVAIGLFDFQSGLLTTAALLLALSLYTMGERRIALDDEYAALADLVDQQHDAWARFRESYEHRFPDRSWDAGPDHQRAIMVLTSITSERDRLSAEVDGLVRFWQDVMNVTRAAGYPPGDKAQVVDNVRRMAEQCKAKHNLPD